MLNTAIDSAEYLKRGFQPPILLLQALRRAARPGDPVFSVALERENGYVSRYDLPIPAKAEDNPLVIRLAERVVKFLLWASGGWRIMVAGPRSLCLPIAKKYTLQGVHKFDCQFMQSVYQRPVVVEVFDDPAKLPRANERALKIDQKMDGCRIGFDLGASDFKISAVKDGEVTFSQEFPWDPRNNSDPEYHYNKLNDGLKTAAKTLPRVDVIGGSTAGVIVDNRMCVASLFRGIPDDKKPIAQNMFKRLRDDWKIPVEVQNDGDVTALAGRMTLDKTGILGVAMGSSEAVGYIDRKGCLTGRLSELAFATVDMREDAPADEWSGDLGVGAMYYSQQAVNHLALVAGMKFPDDMPLPERLKVVQAKMAEGDVEAMKIFQKIGMFLGYTVPWYREFYEFDNLMILGRVTSGNGGIQILETSRLVLEDQFPSIADEVEVFLPDEKFRRLGQSVAAACIPEIK